MIVFDLKCDASHVFEAWFASSDSFADQQAQGLLCCPFCASTTVEKAPMAARLPAKANQRADAPAQPMAKTNGPPPPELEKIKAALSAATKAQAEMLKKSSWVGRDFDKQARAMDAGETPHSPIHGEVSPKEAAALAEDGIAVAPLPFPIIPPEKQN
jgi:hypothetical protein